MFEDNSKLKDMKIFVPPQLPLLQRALKVFSILEVEHLAASYGKKHRIDVLDFEPIINVDDLHKEFMTF